MDAPQRRDFIKMDIEAACGTEPRVLAELIPSPRGYE